MQGPGGKRYCGENTIFARLDNIKTRQVFSPSVRGGAAHVLLKPALKISKLMLHSVYNLHGCVQIATTQAIIDDRPDWLALDLTILLPTQLLTVAMEPSVNLSPQFSYSLRPGVTALGI